MKGKTWTHIFGTQQTALERFILKRDLMGPNWLRIKSFKRSSSPVSWCKLEIIVDNMNNIAPVSALEQMKETPPLKVLSLSMKTVMNNNSNEIVMISGIVHEKGTWVALTIVIML
jgi:DNA polymerase alpha subunit A